MLTSEHICVIILSFFEVNMKKHGTILAYYLLNCALPILFGTLIYIFFRQNTYIHKILGYCPQNIPSSKPIDFIRFYLPDALWAYSLTFALSFFLREMGSGCIAFGWGVLWELFQRYSIVPGTFDIVDILMYLAASCLAVMIIYLTNRREHYEKDF